MTKERRARLAKEERKRNSCEEFKRTLRRGRLARWSAVLTWEAGWREKGGREG